MTPIDGLFHTVWDLSGFQLKPEHLHIKLEDSGSYLNFLLHLASSGTTSTEGCFITARWRWTFAFATWSPLMPEGWVGVFDIAGWGWEFQFTMWLPPILQWAWPHYSWMMVKADSLTGFLRHCWVGNRSLITAGRSGSLVSLHSLHWCWGRGILETPHLPTWHFLAPPQQGRRGLGCLVTASGGWECPPNLAFTGMDGKVPIVFSLMSY